LNGSPPVDVVEILYCSEQGKQHRLCMISNSSNIWQGFIYPNPQYNSSGASGNSNSSGISTVPPSTQPIPVPGGLAVPQSSMSVPQNTMAVPQNSLGQSNLSTQGHQISSVGPVGVMPMAQGPISIPQGAITGSDGIGNSDIIDPNAPPGGAPGMRQPPMMVLQPPLGTVNMPGGMNIQFNTTNPGVVGNPLLVGIPQHPGNVTMTNQFKSNQLLQLKTV